jgi:hypothetical protein
MRIYKVSMEGDFGRHAGIAKWTSRKSDVPRLRREIREECFDPDGRSDVIEGIEFRPTKAGIIAMLNTFARRG